MQKNEKQEMLEEWNWETMNPTGRIVSRNRAHSEGIPHEGVHLWIISTLNGEPSLLFQKRSAHKDSYPGFLDITVGGHVPFGLNNKKINKEAFEEVGLDLEGAGLTDLGFYRYEAHEAGGRFHREIQHVYLLRDERPLYSYSFTDGEVSALYNVRIKDFKGLFDADNDFEVEVYDGNLLYLSIISKNIFHPLFFHETMNEYMKIIFSSSLELVKNGQVKTYMPFKK